MQQNNWFTSWFNTSYYHLLYSDRNDEDAKLFIDTIVSFLKLSKDSKILDIPCGKGRHAKYLNSLGYDVLGIDLSEKNIAIAKQFENKKLSFRKGDIRAPLDSQYDVIFNLHTSFGYFDTDKEHIDVLKNIKKSINANGLFILDFLNVEKVKKELISSEIKTVKGVDFHIHREIKDGFILKHISFTDKGKSYNFTERVKYLDFNKFESYFKEAHLKIENHFGDYNLNEFNSSKSDRLIFIVS